MPKMLMKACIFSSWDRGGSDLVVNIYLRSDTYFLLFFASMLLIQMLFDVLMYVLVVFDGRYSSHRLLSAPDVLMSNLMFFKGANDI